MMSDFIRWRNIFKAAIKRYSSVKMCILWNFLVRLTFLPLINIQLNFSFNGQYPSTRRIAFLSWRVYLSNLVSSLAIKPAVQYQLSFNSPNYQLCYNWHGGLHQHDSVHLYPGVRCTAGADIRHAVPREIPRRNRLGTVDNNLLPLSLTLKAKLLYYIFLVLSNLSQKSAIYILQTSIQF